MHSALAAAAVCMCSAAKASAGNDNMHAAAWKVKIAAEGWQACAACESVNSGLSYPFFPWCKASASVPISASASMKAC